MTNETKPIDPLPKVWDPDSRIGDMLTLADPYVLLQGIAGGTSLLAQRLLEAVFGEDAVRRLADHARRQLADRVDALLADEAARFTTILDSLAVDADATDRLEGAAAGLRDGARAAFDDLTAPELD